MWAFIRDKRYRYIRVSTVLVNANEVFITRPKVIKNCTMAQLLYLTGQFNDHFVTGYISYNFACNCLILNNRQKMLLWGNFKKESFLHCNPRHKKWFLKFPSKFSSKTMNLLLGTGSFYNNRLEKLRNRPEGSVFSLTLILLRTKQISTSLMWNILRWTGKTTTGATYIIGPWHSKFSGLFGPMYNRNCHEIKL